MGPKQVNEGHCKETHTGWDNSQMNGGQWQTVWWPEGGGRDRGEDAEVVRVTSNEEGAEGAGHLDWLRPSECDL